MSENCVEILGKKARQAEKFLNTVSQNLKNDALLSIADALVKNTEFILFENKKDVENAQANGISKAMCDRLALTSERIKGIADGVKKVADLPDPIGGADFMTKRPNGLVIAKRRVPLGVVGVIYEARPNVTVDTAVLCLKSSNAVILRGGKEAVNSNLALAKIMQDAISPLGFPDGTISLVPDTSRDSANAMMTANEYIDVLIPRGGASLINAVVKNATVPVIQTGVGNCHAYVDDECDFDMAVDIIVNAKTSRPSVCNALETVLINKNIDKSFYKKLEDALRAKNVEIRGCDECLKVFETAKKATEDDYKYEFLDYIIAVKIVDGMDEALAHIDKYGTKHSEVIITENYEKANKFLDSADAAAVYVNASTRFTDGGEFGLGAEIGISTQKMHARGPMGLNELTSYKYVVYGNGQIR
ncbi:glutamate-5-semialdehyde dehydrogenase [Qingrenia yutianensis]|uniref:Gamma-glutamyl phosphate reductase n=1 Tax=Qingrenia yutianensis TaxID=2763676 RepID=A0A926FCW5_9FIRM|nr:glutamate-5-semialdehyde dehydrogenase [Qingrenia yutianensis]MBC8595960.1 glutamate-5-semialdehyde dehydrogenase [Qingrenia yutianensis]